MDNFSVRDEELKNEIVDNSVDNWQKAVDNFKERKKGFSPPYTPPLPCFIVLKKERKQQ